MSTSLTRSLHFTSDWLALREPADAAARSTELLDLLPGDAAVWTIRDLGCGTGSMARWLAGRLRGPQHWILHDHDADLLNRARMSVPAWAADGSPVTASTRQGDLTALGVEDLAGTSLLTASALLDLLTAETMDGLAEAITEAACPALLTLSVSGRVELTPADPLDAAIEAAFNDHQRHDGLLGPDAVSTAMWAFARRGAQVHTRPSPWRLGPDQSALVGQWLNGWVSAACELQPELAPYKDTYLRRRRDARVWVTVHHEDLLALPEGAAL